MIVSYLNVCSTLGRYARSKAQSPRGNSLGNVATDDNTKRWGATVEEEDRMADDKTLRSPADGSRIAMGEDYEVTSSPTLCTETTTKPSGARLAR